MSMRELQRVCVKLYAAEPGGVSDDVYMRIFHDWIRERALDQVLVDIADYTHAPASPGVMLVSHEASFALDRSDGRFGLLVQRRRPVRGDATVAITTALQQALAVAALLERDSRVAGRLLFDRSTVRVEANDRLLAPNTDTACAALEPYVRSAAAIVFPELTAELTRVENDPRDRLAVELRLLTAHARQSARSPRVPPTAPLH
jgi:hypothetical protein